MTPQNMRHHRRSLRHSLFLLAAMAGVLAYCGWVIAGWTGALWSLVASAVMLPLFRQLPPELLLRAIGARSLAPPEAPLLYGMLRELCERAEIPGIPLLYWVERPHPIAFSIGQAGTSAIVLSQGLVEALDAPELRGVLAHEIAHLKNHDIALMQLAAVVSRLVRVLAQIAFLLLLSGLFLRAVDALALPLVPLALLTLAPIGVALLQLALAREREGEADLEAVEWTGDPPALASALIKIRALDEALLAARFPGASLLRVPPLFRDHPATKERIRRLLDLPRPPGANFSDRSPGARRRGA